MNFQFMYDFLLIGVPEALLSIFICLYLFTNNIHSKKKAIFIAKCMISSVIVLTIIYTSRYYLIEDSKTMHFTIHNFITALSYFLIFFTIWRFNFAQSAFSGLIIVHILMFSETATVQLLTEFIKKLIESRGFFSITFWWSLPTRIIQLAILIVLILFKIKFTKKNSILDNKFTLLNRHEKITVSLILLLFSISIFINTQYGAIFLTIMTNENIPIEPFRINLYYILFGVIIFLITSLVLFWRTITFESLKDYRDIRERSKIIYFSLVLAGSTENDRQHFREMLDEYESEEVL